MHMQIELDLLVYHIEDYDMNVSLISGRGGRTEGGLINMAWWCSYLCRVIYIYLIKLVTSVFWLLVRHCLPFTQSSNVSHRRPSGSGLIRVLIADEKNVKPLCKHRVRGKAYIVSVLVVIVRMTSHQNYVLANCPCEYFNTI